MQNARARFWILAVLAGAAWLSALFLGGARFDADALFHGSLYARGDAVLARNARGLSFLGSGLVLSGLTIAAAIFLFFRRRIRAALLLITVFSGRMLVELQKVVIQRERPGVDEHLEAVTSTSFPSGHAANAMITFLAIALLVPAKQSNRAISIALAVALALLVGWSRVALGVHWASDVVGGWAFGLLWVGICMRLASARKEGEANH